MIKCKNPTFITFFVDFLLLFQHQNHVSHTPSIHPIDLYIAMDGFDEEEDYFSCPQCNEYDSGDDLHHDEDIEFLFHENGDSYLLNEILPPVTEKWNDVDASSDTTKFTIDSAKANQWTLAQEEICHIMKSLHQITDKDDVKDMKFQHIIHHVLGIGSDFYNVMKESLQLDNETYLQVLSTISLQAAYLQCPSHLFNSNLQLKHAIKIKEK